MPKLKAIPSRLYRSFGPALVGAVAIALATTALADPVWDKVGEAFGKVGTEIGRVASTGSRCRAPTSRRHSTGSN
jgi:hypothetical protein